MTGHFKTTIAAALAIAAGTFSTQAAFAGSTAVKGVVELFTSQGCSSCPPADKVLESLAKRKDVVTLGYHVDYWDYLGWKDSLGSPDNTARQYAYRRSLGSSSVYTPQAVLNGAAHANGGDARSVEKALKEPLPIQLGVSENASSVLITIPTAAVADQHVQAVMVRYGADRTVAVERGENRGRSLHYVNPVVSIQTLGMWHGEARELELPNDAVYGDGGDGCAVLLQVIKEDGSPGRILGAVQID
ncbi:MAG: DUF1223 domain-containing protein [Brucellaceae bacterium]|nr:DUF1223 domain-containing protein [Brucellaceae bacterium]